MAMEYKNSLGRYRRYLTNLQEQPLWNASFWLGLTIALVIAMVIFFLRPTLVVISGLLGDVKENRILLERIDGKITIVNEAQANYNTIKENLEILGNVLPEETLWEPLATNIFTAASESGTNIKKLTIKDVTISGTETSKDNKKPIITELKLPKNVEGVKFEMEVTGGYKQIKLLLEKLENSGRILVLESARINKYEDGSLGLTISGKAPYFYLINKNETQGN